MSHTTHVHKEEFDRIKQMQAVGLKSKQIQDLTGRNYGTVRRVLEQSTWKPHTRKRKPVQQALQVRTTKTPTPDEIVQAIDNLNVMHYKLANRVSVLKARVEALEKEVLPSNPQRRRRFWE